MAIRFDRPRRRSPVPADVTCPACGRPLECARVGSVDELVSAHLRYSCVEAA